MLTTQTTNNRGALIRRATDFDLQLGKEFSPEDFKAYEKACKFRDAFLAGKISFEDYLDALSPLPIDLDDYIENVYLDLGIDL